MTITARVAGVLAGSGAILWITGGSIPALVPNLGVIEIAAIIAALALGGMVLTGRTPNVPAAGSAGRTALEAALVFGGTFVATSVALGGVSL